MIKTIVFDLDDTLLWDKKSVATAFERTCSFAAEEKGIDPTALEEAVRTEARSLYATYETFEFTKMIGINPFEGLWGAFDDKGEMFQKMKNIVPTYRQEAWTKGLRQLGVEDPQFGALLAARFVEERKQHPFLYEESLHVLEKLQNDYQLVLLTNGSPSLQQLKLTITPEIAPYFDHIIISGDFGRGKPDVSIFQYALEQAGVQADEALMVGDNLMTDILGANRAGIRSVWINREQQQRSDVSTPTFEIQHLSELFEIIQNANASTKE